MPLARRDPQQWRGGMLPYKLGGLLDQVGQHIREQWTPTAFPNYEQLQAMAAQRGPITADEVASYGVDMASPFAKLGGLFGHTVWHGSPHKWDIPDISKVGTGEGAQAYGHGFYSAEARDVAENYRKQLTERGGPEGAAAYMQRMYKDSALDYAKSQSEMPNLSPEARKFAQEAYEILKRGDIHQGHLYKLDIPDEDIPKYLDWDKPLGEQSDEVKNILRKKGITGKQYQLQVIGDGPSGDMNDRFVFNSATEAREMAKDLRKQGYSVKPYIFSDSEDMLTGQALYADLANLPFEASGMLRNLGIPGIRYLDQGSRGTGQGTYNYVTFDPSRIKVLERR